MTPTLCTTSVRSRTDVCIYLHRAQFTSSLRPWQVHQHVYSQLHTHQYATHTPTHTPPTLPCSRLQYTHTHHPSMLTTTAHIHTHTPPHPSMLTITVHMHTHTHTALPCSRPRHILCTPCISTGNSSGHCSGQSHCAIFEITYACQCMGGSQPIKTGSYFRNNICLPRHGRGSANKIKIHHPTSTDNSATSCSVMVSIFEQKYSRTILINQC